MTIKRISVLLIVFSLLFSLSGCLLDPDRRARIDAQNELIREANEQMSAIKTVGMLYPDVHLFQVSPGAKEQMDEWTEQATPILIDAVKREMPNHGITVKLIAPKGEMTPEMKNSYLMYRKITKNIGWNATYRKALCPDVQACPHYSLGKVAQIFDDAQADALLYVMVYNEIETAEAKEARQLYNIKRAFMGALGTVYISLDRHPGLYMSMALVNRKGEIFWYSSRWIGKGYDLRVPANAEDLTKRILVRLQAREKW